MANITSVLKGKKTYIISILLVSISVVNLLVGDLSLQEFLRDPNLLVLLNGLGLAAMRNGIEG
jgi:hypothetical protein